MRSLLLALIAVIYSLPLGALADDASPGLWRESGYMEDETGKRTICNGGEICFNSMPVNPKLGTLCASARDLQVYAHQKLAEYAVVFRARLHNCNDTADGGVTCDEGSLTRTISPPNATQVEFSFTTQGQGHRMTRLWHYERLGDDCSTANGALRPSQ